MGYTLIEKIIKKNIGADHVDSDRQRGSGNDP